GEALADAAARTRVAGAVRGVLDRALADSAFPGAIAVVGDAAGGMVTHAVGRIDWAADAPAPDRRTLWDLASLTKVVGTTSAVMQLVGAGRIQLDAPVQRYLPDWTGANKEAVTIRHLLTHASGLPAWRPLYKEAADPASALALVLSTQLEAAPGARYVYSDMNFILLGEIARRLTGQPLDAYLAARVFGPLRMTDARFRPPASELARIAPTEYDPWRQRKVRGEVHDENAFALGGVAGHAGLFGTAADLERLARAYLNGGTLDGARVFDAATLAQFTRVQDTTVSRRALGWETPTGGNSAGHYLSRRAFGHTGFTGTSLWIDPERGVYVLLLTNRVNPTRQNPRIGGVRVALADSALRALGASPVFPTPAAPAPRP
ncbi:serine hydrolase domain-containing protein, partial [Roseisolibacter sp. H3M3-2]|uniref:serine hydrolase domain-containing protein n=1 Tax=Roseisolibacter sp. H3M3-2 TaxID=3031323 RepID=UPI0023DBF8BC